MCYLFFLCDKNGFKPCLMVLCKSWLYFHGWHKLFTCPSYKFLQLNSNVAYFALFNKFKLIDLEIEIILLKYFNFSSQSFCKLINLSFEPLLAALIDRKTVVYKICLNKDLWDCPVSGPINCNFLTIYRFRYCQNGRLTFYIDIVLLYMYMLHLYLFESSK